jgi:two-component system sensor histidine kinase/response regulator
MRMEKILIIDDNLDHRNAIQFLLEKEGYIVIPANNGKTGLKLLNEHFDIRVIIVDLAMLELSGVDVLKIIKDRRRPLRRIVLTAYDGELSFTEAKELKVFFYLNKPITKHILLFTVNAALNDLNSENLELHSERQFKEIRNMATDFVHWFGNKVSLIPNYLDLIQEEVKALPASIAEKCNKIKKIVEEVINIETTLLRPFKETAPEIVSVDDIMNQVITSLKRKDIEVSFNYKLEEPKAIFSAFELKNIFEELVNNAENAMENSVKKQLIITILEGINNRVIIKIKDSGYGIKEEDKDKIFRAFYSDKKSKGYGVGLFIVKNTLAKFGGTIEFTSKAGEGTEFTISLIGELKKTTKDQNEEGFLELNDKVTPENHDPGYNQPRNQIFINDQWILERLENKELFKSLGIKDIERFDDKIKNAFRDYKNGKYSVWFSEETYESIFNKRIYPILEIAGLEDIASSLKSFLWFERAAYIGPFYSSDKRYRDHFLHQLRIAVLGDFFLNAEIIIKDKCCKIVEKIVELLKKRKSPREFQFSFDERSIRNTWWVTALMHDCSYALYSIFSPHLFEKESLEKLKNIFDVGLYEKYKNNHEEAEKKLIEDIKNKLPEMIKEVELKSFEDVILNAAKTKKMHSIYGAYNFWKKYPHMRDKKFCFELAVQSILLHHEFCDSEKEEPSITFEEYPLAFLLILMDEIQEWGRPLIINVKEKDRDPISISKIIELDEVSVKGIIENPKGFILDEKGLNFFFNYKKKSAAYAKTQTGLDSPKKFNSKKKNLSRLLRHNGIFPPITLDFLFEDFHPDPIKI